MARVYLGHWRWLQQQGSSYKQQAASCKRQAASLTRDLYCVIGYYKGERNMKVNEALKITDSFTRTSKDAWPELQPASLGMQDWRLEAVSRSRARPAFSVTLRRVTIPGYPAIKAAQYRRLKAINHPDWVQAMATVIKRQKCF